MRTKTLKDILLPDDKDMTIIGFVQDYEVEREYDEPTRWSLPATSICEYNGKHYLVNWMRGSTECQEDYFPDEDVLEVEKVEKVITVKEWVPVKTEVISMDFKTITKSEFLNDVNEKELCPNDYELPHMMDCKSGDDEEECKRCWDIAVVNIEFKSELELFKNNNITVIEDLRKCEEEYKTLGKARDKLKEILLQQMEEHGINKFESDVMNITYVAASESTRIDSKGLKQDHPDIFEKYSKSSTTKASIRFKVK